MGCDGQQTQREARRAPAWSALLGKRAASLHEQTLADSSCPTHHHIITVHTRNLTTGFQVPLTNTSTGQKRRVENDSTIAQKPTRLLSLPSAAEGPAAHPSPPRQKCGRESSLANEIRIGLTHLEVARDRFDAVSERVDDELLRVLRVPQKELQRVLLLRTSDGGKGKVASVDTKMSAPWDGAPPKRCQGILSRYLVKVSCQGILAALETHGQEQIHNPSRGV